MTPLSEGPGDAQGHNEQSLGAFFAAVSIIWAFAHAPGSGLSQVLHAFPATCSYLQ